MIYDHRCVGISCNLCGMGTETLEEKRAFLKEKKKVLSAEIKHLWKNIFNTDHSCDVCGDPVVYGDERNAWLGYHLSWYHKLHRAVVRFFLV